MDDSVASIYEDHLSLWLKVTQEQQLFTRKTTIKGNFGHQIVVSVGFLSLLDL